MEETIRAQMAAIEAEKQMHLQAMLRCEGALAALDMLLKNLPPPPAQDDGK